MYARMEENTIFSSTNNTPPNSTINNSFSSNDDFSIKGLLIKALIGIAFLAFIVFLTIRFLLPLFQSKNESVTLTYWGLWEEPKVMQAVIEDFQKVYPNIKVNYVKQDVKQYRERLLTRTQNGTSPDIFRFHNTWLVQIKNILLPLPSETIKKEEFQQWFYPVVQKDLVYNGAIYGIPLEIDTLALFTNTEMFQAAGSKIPTTWDEFSRVARLLTVKEESGRIKTAGVAMGTFDNIAHAPDIISLLFVQNGADIRNLSGTLENTSDALDYYTSFAKGDAIVWDETLEPSTLAFANGTLAMYFGYSWDVFAIKALNPSLEFEISDVPSLPGRRMTIASYWAEGVSAKSKHQKEALLFMRYLAKRETAQKFYSEASKLRLFGEPYARVDLANSLKGNTLVYPFVRQAEGAVSSFFVGETFDNGLNEQMNGYLGNAVRSVVVNTSVQSATTTLSNGVAQVLGQYGK